MNHYSKLLQVIPIMKNVTHGALKPQLSPDVSKYNT